MKAQTYKIVSGNEILTVKVVNNNINIIKREAIEYHDYVIELAQGFDDSIKIIKQ